MQSNINSSLNPVFARTIMGQRVAIGVEQRLEPIEMRFLLMVNGETPLEHLQLIAPDAAQGAVVSKLIRDRLIEPVDIEPLN